MFFIFLVILFISEILALAGVGIFVLILAIPIAALDKCNQENSVVRFFKDGFSGFLFCFILLYLAGWVALVCELTQFYSSKQNVEHAWLYWLFAFPFAVFPASMASTKKEGKGTCIISVALIAVFCIFAKSPSVRYDVFGWMLKPIGLADSADSQIVYSATNQNNQHSRPFYQAVDFKGVAFRESMGNLLKSREEFAKAIAIIFSGKKEIMAQSERQAALSHVKSAYSFALMVDIEHLRIIHNDWPDIYQQYYLNGLRSLSFAMTQLDEKLLMESCWRLNYYMRWVDSHQSEFNYKQ